MTIWKLTVRYASGIVFVVCFTEQSQAHAYYHTRVKPNHRNPPAFIVEPVEVFESAHAAPSEATLQKV